MTTLKHLIDPATEQALRDKVIANQDPTKLHRTAFVEYLEVVARIKSAEGTPFADIEAQLRDDTKAWKAAARAKFNARQGR